MRDILYAAAGRYAAEHGASTWRPYTAGDYGAIVADRFLGARIAAAYRDAPEEITPDARGAYRALREETWRQLDLLGRLGLDVLVSATDPYADAAELHADIAGGILQVWGTAAAGHSHPVFSADDNDAFRAIHDAFGHGALGVDFDWDGEEAAWRHHSTMFSPLALPALATETRGQTAYVSVFGSFPVQKAILLPDWAREAYAA